jgi:hypothetical protein
LLPNENVAGVPDVEAAVPEPLLAPEPKSKEMEALFPPPVKGFVNPPSLLLVLPNVKDALPLGCVVDDEACPKLKIDPFCPALGTEAVAPPIFPNMGVADVLVCPNIGLGSAALGVEVPVKEMLDFGTSGADAPNKPPALGVEDAPKPKAGFFAAGSADAAGALAPNVKVLAGVVVPLAGRKGDEGFARSAGAAFSAGFTAPKRGFDSGTLPALFVLPKRVEDWKTEAGAAAAGSEGFACAPKVNGAAVDDAVEAPKSGLDAAAAVSVGLAPNAGSFFSDSPKSGATEVDADASAEPKTAALGVAETDSVGLAPKAGAAVAGVDVGFKLKRGVLAASETGAVGLAPKRGVAAAGAGASDSFFSARPNNGLDGVSLALAPKRGAADAGFSPWPNKGLEGAGVVEAADGKMDGGALPLLGVACAAWPNRLDVAGLGVPDPVTVSSVFLADASPKRPGVALAPAAGKTEPDWVVEDENLIGVPVFHVLFAGAELSGLAGLAGRSAG